MYSLADWWMDGNCHHCLIMARDLETMQNYRSTMWWWRPSRLCSREWPWTVCGWERSFYPDSDNRNCSTGTRAVSFPLSFIAHWSCPPPPTNLSCVSACDNTAQVWWISICVGLLPTQMKKKPAKERGSVLYSPIQLVNSLSNPHALGLCIII